MIAYLYSVHTVVASTRLAKYQYQYSRHKYQYLDIKYQHQYQYPSLKCKYQYHYLKTILKYGSSTSRSTQYYNPECSQDCSCYCQSPFTLCSRLYNGLYEFCDRSNFVIPQDHMLPMLKINTDTQTTLYL